MLMMGGAMPGTRTRSSISQGINWVGWQFYFKEQYIIDRSAYTLFLLVL